MRLSRSSDYALRAIIYLAGLPAGGVASGLEVAEATGIAKPFLSKVLAFLVRGRMVAARRGAGGGYHLTLPACEISMLRVIEAVDGPMELGTCLVDGQQCERKSWCGVHVVLAEMHQFTVRLLRETSIEKLRGDSEMRRGLVQSISSAPGIEWQIKGCGSSAVS